MIAEINVKRMLTEEAANVYIIISYFILQYLQHTKKTNVKLKPINKMIHGMSNLVSLDEFKVHPEDVENVQFLFIFIYFY